MRDSASASRAERPSTSRSRASDLAFRPAPRASACAAAAALSLLAQRPLLGQQLGTDALGHVDAARRKQVEQAPCAGALAHLEGRRIVPGSRRPIVRPHQDLDEGGEDRLTRRQGGRAGSRTRDAALRLEVRERGFGVPLSGVERRRGHTEPGQPLLRTRQHRGARGGSQVQDRRESGVRRRRVAELTVDLAQAALGEPDPQRKGACRIGLERGRRPLQGLGGVALIPFEVREPDERVRFADAVPQRSIDAQRLLVCLARARAITELGPRDSHLRDATGATARIAEAVHRLFVLDQRQLRVAEAEVGGPDLDPRPGHALRVADLLVDRERVVQALQRRLRLAHAAEEVPEHGEHPRAGRGPPGGAMDRERPLHEPPRFLQSSQAHLDLGEAVAHACLRPFVAQLYGHRQRAAVGLRRARGLVEIERRRVADHHQGPQLHPALAQGLPRGQRDPIVLELRARVLVRDPQGVDSGEDGLHAQTILGSGLAQRHDLDDVPPPRRGRDLVHPKRQRVRSRGDGDDGEGIRPDRSARGVRREEDRTVRPRERLDDVGAPLLDQHVQVFARAQIELVAMRVPGARLALDRRSGCQPGRRVLACGRSGR